MADSYAGLRIIDISDPESAAVVRTVATAGRAFGVAVSGTQVYLAGWTGGLHIIGFSTDE